MLRCFVFLFLILLPLPSAHAEDLEITFLNAGYADAVLIRVPDGRHILFDAGDVGAPDLVADFLKSRGVKRLEFLILSHPNKNHFGAMFRVVEEVEIGGILWNGETDQEEPFADLLKKIEQKKLTMRVMREGSLLEFGGVSISVLHPTTKLGSNVNDNSLALQLKHGDVRILLTGDIGYGVQNRLIKKYGKKLRSELVQIPHHGGPISEKFIDFFKPDFFVLSTGPNEWGQPREAEVAKLKSPVLRTDRHGTLAFRSDGKKISRI